MTDRVIIDTCIWASVFAKAGSPHQQAVERLIDQDRAVLIGPVLTEVLYGGSEDRNRPIGRHPV